MNVVLEPKGKLREGDVIAISHLHNLLAKSRKKDEPITKLWIDFLRKIQVEIVGANYAQRKAKSTFDFPFEKEYAKRHPEDILQ